MESDVKMARETLQKEASERIQKCASELKELLARNKCTLEVSMLVTARGNIPQINIMPVLEEE